MRSIGMDVHRSFAQVAVLDRGKVAEEFRVELNYDAVVAFGQKLRKDDEVILKLCTGISSSSSLVSTTMVCAAGARYERRQKWTCGEFLLWIGLADNLSGLDNATKTTSGKHPELRQQKC